MAGGGHGGGGKAVVAAFFANLGIAIAKFIGFAFTGSSSMLAEGVHSLADTGNQARTQHVGPEDVLVAAKLEFAADLDMAELARAVDAAEARVRARVPAARLMFLEPDLRRPVPGFSTAGVAPSAAAGPLEPELPRPH